MLIQLPVPSNHKKGWKQNQNSKKFIPTMADLIAMADSIIATNKQIFKLLS